MTATSTPAGDEAEPEAADAVGVPAADPALDAMAQRVLTRGHTTTWLSRWSLLHADFRALVRMHTVDFDRTFLQMRLRAAGHEVVRASTDFTLPHVFECLEDGTHIALIGAVLEAGQATADHLHRFDVQVADEYEGLRWLKTGPSVLIAFDPHLVIVGLGAGFQEVVTSFVFDLLPEASVRTMGGWIDQYARTAGDYFPTWVHTVRLGWAWRTAYEPKRLTRRYTVETLDFVAHTSEPTSRLGVMGSFDDLRLVGGVTLR